MSTDTNQYGGLSAEEQYLLGAMASEIVTRSGMQNRGMQQYGGDRDLDDALGYPKRLRYSDYKDWYERGDIAKVIIDKPAEKAWQEDPVLVDDATGAESLEDFDRDDLSGFESDAQDLFDASGDAEIARGLGHYFERVDKLARLGEYAVLYIGLSDVSSADELNEPVTRGSITGLDDILQVVPLAQPDAQINTWVRDVTDPRNGLPKTYKLELSNGGGTQTEVVHHERVIHVAEGILDNEIRGQPALKAVINRLFDLQKTVGSAAEAYWMLSNPGLVLSVDPEFQDVPTDVMDEQVDEYEHHMRRVLKLFGTEATQLESQDVDPTGLVDSLLKLIAGTVEIPQRKLTGSERGELASSQDDANFVETIASRQTSYNEPVIVRRFFDRVVDFGAVDAPGAGTYAVFWPDLFQLTDLETAELRKLEAEAAQLLAPMGELDLLHSIDALRNFSPIEEPEGAEPPDPDEDEDEDDIEDIDEEDEDVMDQFNAQFRQ